ncbi:hypothetical protein B566_EDAN005621 [Ephemera danica]|nr:hypothetical protein B566_EDAN005621 [Ephemera danica]
MFKWTKETAAPRSTCGAQVKHKAVRQGRALFDRSLPVYVTVEDNPDVVIDVGSKLKLRCGPQSDNSDEQTPILPIKPARLGDSGQYACLPSGQDWRNVTVRVVPGRAGPEALALQQIQEEAPTLASADLPQSLALPAGSNYVFTCNPTAGNPTPSLSWQKNGEPMVDASILDLEFPPWSLVLEDLNMQDAAIYTCTLQNSAGSVQHEFKLEVYDSNGGRSPVYVKPEENKTVFAGSFVVFVCDAETRSVTWVRRDESDSQQVQDTEWVQKHEVKRSTPFDRSLPVYVTVEDNPDVVIDVGSKLKLRCGPQSDNSDEQTPILPIKPARLGDSGQYACLPSGQDWRNVTVRVVPGRAGPEALALQQIQEEAPTLASADLPQSLALPAGSNYVFTCNPTAGNPTPSLSWQRNGEPMVDASILDLEFPPWSLVLEDLNMQDAAIYTCTLQNSAGSVQHEFKLEVYDSNGGRSPVYVKPEENKTVFAGSFVVFVCDAETRSVTWVRRDESDSQQVQDTEWVQKHEVKLRVVGTTVSPSLLLILDNSLSSLGPNSTSFNFKVLRLLNATLSQDTTEVEDLPERNPDEETGTVDETEELRAPYFPKLDKMHRSVIKPAGNMIRLKCNAEGNPEPNITWYKDWVPPVRQLGAIQYGRWSMVLEDIVTSDSGNYTCVVCNEYGCINFTYKVEVMERLPHRPYIKEGFPKNQTVLSGSNVQFECPTISDLEPFIQWIKVNFSDIIEKNSTEKPKGVVLQVAAESLTSDALTSPQLRCWSRERLHHRPIFTESLKNTTVVLGSTARFQCRILSDLHPHIEWYRLHSKNARLPHRPYIKEGFPKNQTVLSGSNVQFDCPTISDLEPFIQWIKVNFSDIIEKNSTEKPKGVVLQKERERLHHRPIFTESLKNTTVVLGSTARFQCRILSDLHPHIEWYRLHSFDHDLDLNITHNTSNMVKTNTMANVVPEIFEIKNVTEEDEGWYTCVAGNTLGWSQSTAYLRVVDSLDTEPTSVHQSHPMLLNIFLGVLCIVLVLGSVVTIAMIRRLKREKMKKLLAIENARAAVVTQWIKKVIVEKQSLSDAECPQDALVTPTFLRIRACYWSQHQGQKHADSEGPRLIRISSCSWNGVPRFSPVI